VARRRDHVFLQQDYDLVVIGSGPAAVAAARAARQVNARVVVVAEGPFGRPIASRALLAAGLQGQPFAGAVAHARAAVATIAAADGPVALRKAGIDVIEGAACFVAPGEIEVADRRVRSGRFVIATGSRPAMPSIEGLAGIASLTIDDVLALESPPSSVAVVGAGAAGCEVAEGLARLGVRVTLLEARDRVLPGEEPEASEVVANTLRAVGVDVRLSASVGRVEADETQGGARLWAERTGPVVADRLIVTVGRTPTTAGLQLDTAGVQRDALGFVRVDAHLRTNVPGTYAAGGVTGQLFVAHGAAEMGRIAAGHALKRGQRRRFVASRVPRVVFTSTEVARVGITEAQAGRTARVAYVPLSEVHRALADDATQGYVKLIAAPRVPTGRLFGGRIVGATIVAPRAGEMIAEVALAMRVGMFPAQLARASHAYPTWSSALQDCAMQFFAEVDGRSARRVRR
jgi:pyruvate/2-oxoglutarate dehydrogenase complex dihydrolipoamide dehydrogenase (E3) component